MWKIVSRGDITLRGKVIGSYMVRKESASPVAKRKLIHKEVTSNMKNEPDILGGSQTEFIDSDFAAAKADLLNYDEATFQRRYKATKRQYSALIRGIESLREAVIALTEQGPLEFDDEIIDNTRYLIEDFATLMEQMQNAAAFWLSEE